MIEIKFITSDQIPEVVRIHNCSFNSFFLTQLGDKFLAIYYETVRSNNEGILLGAYIENILVGFCAATFYSNGFNKKLIKNNFSLYSLVAIKLLFTKPLALYRLFKNLTKKNSTISDNGEYAELLSIAVDVNKQGLGIGKELMNRLEKELLDFSCSELSLTTDYANNNKAVTFYKNIGFSIIYEFDAWPNRKMYRLIKQLKFQ